MNSANLAATWQTATVFASVSRFPQREIPELWLGILAGYLPLMLKKLPRCSKCGQPMRFVRSLPAVGGLSELQSYECRGCRETITIAVDDKNKIRSATENYQRRHACR